MKILSKITLFPSPGITLRTERLISDFSTPSKELILIQLEMLINGLSADGTLDPKSKTTPISTNTLTTPKTGPFATPLKLLSMLNPDISSLLFASSGLIL